MAEIINYITVNGGTAQVHEYTDQVDNQQDIEDHRALLIGIQVKHGYEVLFTIRQPKGIRLSP